jgi:hypothetical protein
MWINDLIEFFDGWAVKPAPGELIYRFHGTADYCFPRGAMPQSILPTRLSCCCCGEVVWQAVTVNGSTVLTCFCLVVALHPSNRGYLPTAVSWAQLYAEASNLAS